MPIEIERKFLTVNDSWRAQATTQTICQSYLLNEPHRSVRIRIIDSQATLTVKGRVSGDESPATANINREFEYDIPLEDARELLDHYCDQGIEKRRHRVTVGPHVWEVDEFLALNAGLIVAEIELKSETESFSAPPWLGEEVTNDSKYLNVELARHPYSQWNR